MSERFGACGGCGCPDIEIHECEECERECCSECGRFGEAVHCDTAECWAELEAKAEKWRDEYLAHVIDDDEHCGLL